MVLLQMSFILPWMNPYLQQSVYSEVKFNTFVKVHSHMLYDAIVSKVESGKWESSEELKGKGIVAFQLYRKINWNGVCVCVCVCVCVWVCIELTSYLTLQHGKFLNNTKIWNIQVEKYYLNI